MRRLDQTDGLAARNRHGAPAGRRSALSANRRWLPAATDQRPGAIVQAIEGTEAAAAGAALPTIELGPTELHVITPETIAAAE